MAEAGGAAPWPKVSSDCATDLPATVLMPSALRPVMSCRRDMPLSRYCLIRSFMELLLPLPAHSASLRALYARLRGLLTRVNPLKSPAPRDVRGPPAVVWDEQR